MTDGQREATYFALDYARRNDTFIVLDPNVRLHLWSDEQQAREHVRRAMGYADVVKLNEEELAFLSPRRPKGFGGHADPPSRGLRADAAALWDELRGHGLAALIIGVVGRLGLSGGTAAYIQGMEVMVGATAGKLVTGIVITSGKDSFAGGMDLKVLANVKAEGGDDPLAEAGHGPGGRHHAGPQPGPVRGLVEDRDVGDGRAEVRVLLEVPHQGLEIGHARVRPDLPFRHRRRRYRRRGITAGSTWP